MNVTKAITKDYEKKTLSERGKNKPKQPKQTQTKPNKPKSKPIKPKSNPKQSQFGQGNDSPQDKF